jgi:hypothetical protein
MFHKAKAAVSHSQVVDQFRFRRDFVFGNTQFVHEDVLKFAFQRLFIHFALPVPI